jgi:hypothetical protein
MFSIGSIINPHANAQWHFVPELFSDEECDQILAIQLPEFKKKFHYFASDDTFVNYDHAPLYANDHPWIFERMANAIAFANNSVWKYQIEGFFEDAFRVQYKTGDREGYHYDVAPGADGYAVGALRKLTIDVQLTDPHTYGGCDYRPYGEGWHGWEGRKVRGSAIIRPCHFLYEVSECYSGTRDIIRAFVHGQHLR